MLSLVTHKIGWIPLILRSTCLLALTLLIGCAGNAVQSGDPIAANAADDPPSMPSS